MCSSRALWGTWSAIRVRQCHGGPLLCQRPRWQHVCRGTVTEPVRESHPLTSSSVLSGVVTPTAAERTARAPSIGKHSDSTLVRLPSSGSPAPAVGHRAQAPLVALGARQSRRKPAPRRTKSRTPSRKGHPRSPLLFPTRPQQHRPHSRSESQTRACLRLSGLAWGSGRGAQRPGVQGSWSTQPPVGEGPGLRQN